MIWETIGMELKHSGEIAEHTGTTIEGGEQGLAIHLLTSLQTSLEPENLLKIFSREIKQLIPHSGFHYKYSPLNIDFRGGLDANHSCHYDLNLDGLWLGKITLTRRERFQASELQTLENLLGNLFYPLRNALLYQQAVKSAYTDPLTGLYNRSTLSAIFDRESVLAKRKNSTFSVLMLDIDHFKKVNDTYGHAVGDEVLKIFSSCLTHTLRGSDAIFRTGGEEFVVILSETDRHVAAGLAERLRRVIEQTNIKTGTDDLHITTSIGVAEFDQDADTEVLLKRADEALYLAKKTGRNQVKIAP